MNRISSPTRVRLVSPQKLGFALALSLIALNPLSQAQESRAYFDAPSVVLNLDSAPFQKLFDFDGDGDMDAFGSRRQSDGKKFEVTVWENDGNGRMTETFTSLVSAYQVLTNNSLPDPMTCAVGDFNNDALDDFMIGELTGHSVFLSEGNGQFTRTDTIETSGFFTLTAADFDGDGSDDRFLLMLDGLGLGAKIYLANGAIIEQSLNFSNPFNYKVLIVETDGDGLPDFAIAAQNLVQLYSIENGAIIEEQLLQSAALGSSTNMWAAGDVDGDGTGDLVNFGFINGTGHVSEVFTKSVAQTWTANPWQVGGPAEFLADVDGDGDLDGVCCGGGGPTTPTFPSLKFSSTFEIALNDGTGVFAQSFEFDGLGSKHLAGVADLDSDGDADLVAGACIYYSNGPLTESPLHSYGGTHDEFYDLDRDGDADVLTSYQQILPTSLQYVLNQGNDLETVVSIPIPPAPAEFVYDNFFEGDFTGDGAPDIIAFMNQASSNDFVRMVLLRNNGSGKFLEQVPAGINGEKFASVIFQPTPNIMIADADGDGDNDIFARSTNTKPQTKLFLNDGNGFFTWEKLYQMKIESLADFDGDGRLDILGDKNGIATGSNPEMWISLGNPAGSNDLFAPNVNALGAAAPDAYEHRIDVNDFNNDGRPDVAFIDRDDLPRLFFNTTVTPGSCSFQETDILDGMLVEGDNARIFGTDVNDDGLLDIIMTSMDDNLDIGTILLANMPMPTFPALPTSANYDSPAQQLLPGFDTADIDGDGLLDLSGDFKHIHNRHFAPSQGGHREQYGSGTPGVGEVSPIMGASGPFRAGEPASLIFTGAEGGSITFLEVGVNKTNLVDFPIPGLTVYTYPFAITKKIIVNGPLGVAGAGYRKINYAPGTLPVGLPLYFQYFVFDSQGGLSQSNGLELIHDL